MTTRDLISDIDIQKALAAATRTADVNGVGIDTRGFDSCVLSTVVGASGDTLSGSVKVELEVEESDDDSTYTDVADSDLSNYVDGTNDGTFAVIDDGAEDDTVYETEYRGTKRYVRVVANLTGTHTNGIPLAATAILGHAHISPAS